MSSSDAYYGASAASPAAGGTTKPSFTAPSAAMPQQIPTFSSIPGSSLAHSDHSKIFVGGLSWQTNEESLRWHFEQYGPVISVEVMRDRNTGDPRGFAFVVFQDAATVDLVMVDKDKHEINHKIVDVKRAQARGVAPPSIHEKQLAAAAAAAAAAASPRAALPESSASLAAATSATSSNDPSPEQLHCKIFVGGIPPQIDRDELKVIFTEFGTVIDAIVMVDPLTQRSRCFGFVTFDPAQEGAAAAQRAIAAQPLPIQGRPVEVKLATPRAESTPGGAPLLAGGMGMPKRPLPPVAKHVGLRAGLASAAAGEFAGLAVAYGRSGWKAGYGTKAFGAAGWNVFEDTGGGPLPEPAGFSFSMLKAQPMVVAPIKEEVVKKPRRKRARH